LAAAGTLRIGLMGGTFDPIHVAHLVAAEAALEQHRLDRVVFIPTGQPPHKPTDRLTPAEHRYQMVALATASNPRFEVSRVELERPGLSYTVDTLDRLRLLYPPGTDFFFITGTDAILSVETWREPERLFSLCRFIAAGRPGFSRRETESELRRLEEKFGATILEVECPALAVSSSDLRRRVAEGRSIRYLVPELVEAYIQKHGLYRP